MTDDQLATLSVVTVFTDESIMNDLEVSITDVGKCLGTALGIEEFGQMYLKGTKALMSVSSAIKVAKIMIQRYVGYFGALIMLYSFIDCISDLAQPNQVATYNSN